MQALIALDSYDDLFSDFDIRGYEERPFSKDFLDELNLRMINMGNTGNIEVALLIENELRNSNDEKVIKNRMKQFFSDRLMFYKGKNKWSIFKSTIFIATGLVLIFIANYFTKLIPDAFSDFLLIPSWYFVWSGLEQFVERRQGIKEKIRYYNKLRNVHVLFKSK